MKSVKIVPDLEVEYVEMDHVILVSEEFFLSLVNEE